MSDTEGDIQELEHSLMRAWLAQDSSAMKKRMARDFMCMIGTLPPEMLDRPSFLAAVEQGFVLRAFQIRETFVREYGRKAWFVAGGTMEIDLGRQQWRGDFLITDLWQRGAIARSWKLAERCIARIEPDDRLANEVRRLQLWRK
jgi:hypothetical protein